MTDITEKKLIVSLMYARGESYLATGPEDSDDVLDTQLAILEEMAGTGSLARCIGCLECRARVLAQASTVEMSIKDRGEEMRLSIHCGAHRNIRSNREDMACNGGKTIVLEESKTPGEIPTSLLETNQVSILVIDRLAGSDAPTKPPMEVEILYTL